MKRRKGAPWRSDRGFPDSGEGGVLVDWGWDRTGSPSGDLFRGGFLGGDGDAVGLEGPSWRPLAEERGLGRYVTWFLRIRSIPLLLSECDLKAEPFESVVVIVSG